ncbi:MAG: hypothetical protein FJX74_21655, partial [Armatimonadetes bacterium]|nr:hypothetical protein [Armatimonadota bacterium]
MTSKAVAWTAIVALPVLWVVGLVVAEEEAPGTTDSPNIVLSDAVIFQSLRDGNTDIYRWNWGLLNQLTRLTHNAGVELDPAWSKDRTKIAFVSDRTGQRQIFTMLADGTNEKRLTNFAGSDQEPDWSPSGTRLVFVRDATNAPFQSHL